jgi:dephospho-CoA kinase
MLKIGLTGGIGSGKSTVAKIFEVLDVPVYDSDAAARQLMITDLDLKEQILHHFGEAAYVDGQLNRLYLARQVFINPEKLATLNSLVHPVTIRDTEKWVEAQHASYVIKEAALIFESGQDSRLDAVIGVSAPEPLRIQRTMLRDAISREEVLQRMKNQLDEEEKMSRCDYIIHNDDKQAILPQVLDIHHKLSQLAKKK